MQADAIAAVNAGRVPRAFQEELLTSVNALLEAIECVPAPPVTEEEEDEEDQEEEGRGKGKGRKGKDKD